MDRRAVAGLALSALAAAAPGGMALDRLARHAGVTPGELQAVIDDITLDAPGLAEDDDGDLCLVLEDYLS